MTRKHENGGVVLASVVPVVLERTKRGRPNEPTRGRAASIPSHRRTATQRGATPPTPPPPRARGGAWSTPRRASPRPLARALGPTRRGELHFGDGRRRLAARAVRDRALHLQRQALLQVGRRSSHGGAALMASRRGRPRRTMGFRGAPRGASCESWCTPWPSVRSMAVIH